MYFLPSNSRGATTIKIMEAARIIAKIMIKVFISLYTYGKQVFLWGFDHPTAMS